MTAQALEAHRARALRSWRRARIYASAIRAAATAALLGTLALVLYALITHPAIGQGAATATASIALAAMIATFDAETRRGSACRAYRAAITAPARA